MPYDPKYLPANILLSANENPGSLPSAVAGDVIVALSQIPTNRYPDPLANNVRDELAALYGLTRENILVGNGGDELLFDIAFAWGGHGRSMIDCPPTFSVYAANARLCGTTIVNIERDATTFELNEEAILETVAGGSIDYLHICSPNNPTGNVVTKQFVERLLNATDALVVLDEAYGEFAGPNASMRSLLDEHKNLAILRTLSKAYSLAGVRVGYVLAHPDVICELQKVRQPYSVDSFSQVVAEKVLKFRDLFDARTALLVSERDRVYQQLNALEGIQAYPSAGNFVLFRMEQADAGTVWKKLYDQGILVRDFSASPYTPHCLRVSIGMPDQNNEFLAALATILEEA